jgi:hypothetical protein
MKTFFYYKASLRAIGYLQMRKNWIFPLLAVLFFLIVSFLILFDQYAQIGIWFQMSDLHHETFAISAFALAIGILVGAIIKK